MDYSKEEIDDLLESGEGTLEDRRFSTTMLAPAILPPAAQYLSQLPEEDEDGFNEAERREFAATNLNIRSIISYMSMNLKEQFRFLIMAVKRYVSSLKSGEVGVEKVGVVVDYLSSELSRMVISAKKKVIAGGGNLNTILGLSRLGGNVSKVGQKLSRVMVRSDAAFNRSGIIPKNLSEQVIKLFAELIDGILEKVKITAFLDKNKDLVPMDSDPATDAAKNMRERGQVRTLKMSSLITETLGNPDAKIIDREVTDEFTIEGIRPSEIDELEQFITQLEVGNYKMSFDQGNLIVTFYSKINKDKLIQFKHFINEK